MNTLEYSSERKRMSVIVKTEENKYMVYAKGADSMIETLLSEKEKHSEMLKKTTEYLKLFSVNGLRTLMIAYKEITEYIFCNNFNLVSARNLFTDQFITVIS